MVGYTESRRSSYAMLTAAGKPIAAVREIGECEYLRRTRRCRSPETKRALLQAV